MTKKKDDAPELDREKMREVMGALGRIPSEKKDAARARNAKLGGRPQKPLSEIECNCGAGDSLDTHKTTCPRGYAIYRRKRAGTLKND